MPKFKNLFMNYYSLSTSGFWGKRQLKVATLMFLSSIDFDVSLNKTIVSESNGLRYLVRDFDIEQFDESRLYSEGDISLKNDLPHVYKNGVMTLIESQDYFNYSIVTKPSASEKFKIVDYAELTANLPFSLGNILTSADDSNFKQLIYDTDHQEVIEKFDKPYVDTGDIVACLISTNDVNEITQFYNEFIRFDLPGLQGAQKKVQGDFSKNLVYEPQTMLIGVANASKTEFSDPFNISETVVITSQETLGDLLVNVEVL